MAINLAEDILKHTDDEIFEYLSTEARGIRAVFKKALDENNANLLFAAAADIEILTTVLIALNRRNKERKL